MNIVLLGAPGSGKGLISDFLVKNYNLKHFSTGEMLRENIKNGTRLGNIAKEYMDKGNLVPDDLVINMVEEEIKNGDNCFIFDGFPRSLPQAKKLKDICKIDLVISVEVPKEAVIERMLARRVCSNCAKTYDSRVYKKTVCDSCGGNLVTRADDNQQTIENRIKIYNEQTSELKSFYKELGLLKSVDNSGEAQITLQNVKNIIDLLLKK